MTRHPTKMFGGFDWVDKHFDNIDEQLRHLDEEAMNMKFTSKTTTTTTHPPVKNTVKRFWKSASDRTIVDLDQVAVMHLLGPKGEQDHSQTQLIVILKGIDENMRLDFEDGCMDLIEAWDRYTEGR